jgi:hypothetical protein
VHPWLAADAQGNKQTNVHTGVPSTGSAKLKLGLLESSRCSSLSGLDDCGAFPCAGRDLSFLHSVKSDSRVHPTPIPFDSGGFLRWVKRPEREADHLPPYSALCCVAWCVPKTLKAELYNPMSVQQYKYASRNDGDKF